MQITIEAPFTFTHEKREFMESKIKSLDKKYGLNITQANVFFKLDDGSNPKDVLAEIRLRISGSDIFVGNTAEGDERAFAAAFKSLKRQAKKVKEKRKDYKSPVKEMTDIVYNTFENNVKAI